MNRRKSFREYYVTSKYKGYYKLREQNYKLSGKVHLTFTNGERELFAVGKFKEEALRSIFDQIDKLEDAANSSSASEASDKSFFLL